MDAEALAVALRRMLVEEELRETLVTHAYQLATGFTAETCAQKLVNILAMEWNQSDAE
jgi:glycosyltransferase involved in cell wall biosynthesis